jgi:transposase
MSYKHHLSEEQWNKIKDFIPGKKSDSGRSAIDNRQFVEAVMWVGRNGARWRSLPSSYGNWNSTHKRFRRWSRSGIWQVLFNTLADSRDVEWLMIDSTIIRAHQNSAGASKKNTKVKKTNL